MIKHLFILSVTLLCALAAMPFFDGSNDDIKITKPLNEQATNKEALKYRLPNDTAPRVYIIEFDPDFEGEQFTFKGNSTILFEVFQPTTVVTLHKSNIVIDEDSTELIDASGTSQKPVLQEWTSENDFYTMKFEQTLKPGTYTLKMKWANGDDGHDWSSSELGFNRATDRFGDGKFKYLIATLFEPIGARSAFPCWDEPGFKAEFEISIKHFPNYTALSNMPEKSHQQLSDGRIISYFERSVKMSPYLLCLVVADYKSIKNVQGNISFYGLEKDLNSMELSLKISEIAVKVMEAYTGIPYALPKLDQFTFREYQMPAMENWGLITYPASSVIYRNTTLIPDVEQYDFILSLVAHEVAHQWFGNLITPVWWDDLWLSETFASYFSYKIIAECYKQSPDIDRLSMDNVVIENNNHAFDAESSSNPIVVKWLPEDDESIVQMFGTGTYMKGVAVLHMLENVLTESVFQTGIRKYLKKHQFSAVTSDDLWEAFQEAYDETYTDKPLDIKEFMDPWLEQEGAPVVNVTRNYETGETKVTQKNVRDVDSNIKWKIPINYATESNPDFSSTVPIMWINRDEETITLPDISKDDWIILNIQQRGYYLVNYDQENWYRLSKYLIKHHEKINVVNRAQLLSDSFRLIKGNPSQLNNFYNLTVYLHQEKDYLPWLLVAPVLSDMADLFRNTNEEDLFEMYMLFLTDAIAEAKLFDDDSPSAVRIRSKLAPLLCKARHDKCRSYALKLFNLLLENPSVNVSSSRDWKWIIRTGIEQSNDTVWEMFSLNQGPFAQIIPMPNSQVVEFTDHIKNGDIVTTKIYGSNSNSTAESIVELFQSYLESSPDTVNHGLELFYGHFDDIEKFYKNGNEQNFVKIVSKFISSIKKQDQFDQMKAFIKTHQVTFDSIFGNSSVPIDRLLEKTQHEIEGINELTAPFRAFVDQWFTMDDSYRKLSLRE
ncbi:leucyl-cystinyl aminopeptidase-like [Microplitis mediator]|uniref:leucyl-cystinyl aminopeptidase-like n=1 Tax=Microplitis mediator TaxID=375433 RepID=UPI0025573E91|nr:leucyl-cystinyl aminopeptidase-like [Microplitis mediator]